MTFYRTQKGKELILTGVSQAGMDECWDETFQAQSITALATLETELFEPEQRQFIQQEETVNTDSNSNSDNENIMQV